MSKTEQKEIVKIVRKTVLESIRDIFADPDYSLQLKDSIKKRLKKAQTSQKGFISLATARKKYI